MRFHMLLTTALVGAVFAAAQTASPVPNVPVRGLINISDLRSYTIHPGDMVFAEVGIWPYFAVNQLTNVPNPPFPDNLVFWAFGANPGDCRFNLSQQFCINYRFQNAFQVNSTPVTDKGSIYLLDFNAELLNRPEDPKGTAYAQESVSPSGNGAMVLAIVTVAVSERKAGLTNALATEGLLMHLSGGATAVPANGTTMMMRLNINPAGPVPPHDAQVFTLGGYDSTQRVKDAIMVQVNSSLYSTLVNASVVGIYVQPAGTGL
jgi:hypothetical protein